MLAILHRSAVKLGGFEPPDRQTDCDKHSNSRLAHGAGTGIVDRVKELLSTVTPPAMLSMPEHSR